MFNLIFLILISSGPFIILSIKAGMTTPLTYIKPPYYHYCLMFSCVSTIYKLVLLMREFKVQVSHSLIIKFCRIWTNSTFWWLLFAKLWLKYGCIKLGKYLMLLKLIHLIVHIKYYKYKKVFRLSCHLKFIHL